MAQKRTVPSISHSNPNGTMPKLKDYSVYQIFQDLYAEHFLIKNLPTSEIFNKLSFLLLKENDSESFKQWVETILIAVPRGAPSCSSVRKFHTSYQYFQHVLLPDLEKLNYDKTCHTFVEKELISSDIKHWELLSRRIGEYAVKYIFCNCSLFLRLKESCFLQVAGVSVEYIYQNKQETNKRDVKNSSSKKRLMAQNNQSPAKRMKGLVAETVVQCTLQTTKPHRKRRRKKRMKHLCQAVEHGCCKHECGFEFSYFVPWHSILRTRRGREGLSHQFILNRVDESAEGVDTIIEDICNIEVRKQGNIVNGVEMLNNKHLKEIVRPVVKELISNHKHFKYRSLIYQHCPIPKYQPIHITGKEVADHHPASYSSDGTEPTKEALFLLQSYNTSSEVIRFLKVIILKVIPVEYFGSKHNQNGFIKTVTSLITASSSDTLCLGYFLWNVKVKDMKWIRAIHCIHVQEQFTAQLILWLLNFVLEVIKGFFYITEMASCRYQIFFFRHTVWNRIYSKAFKDLISAGVLKPVEKVNSSALGINILRFIPKRKSARPICILNKASKQDVNLTARRIQLRRVLPCLNEVLRHKKGAGQLGTAEFEENLHKFRHHLSQSPTSEPVYYVKVDVENCFGSMLQTKALQIAEELLNEVFPHQILPQGIIKFKMISSGIASNYKMFAVCGRKAVYRRVLEQSSSLYANSIVRLQKSKEMSVSDVMTLLKPYVLHHSIQEQNQFYEQTIGIVQGGALSMALCDLYYGYLDITHLVPFLNDTNTLLARKVDDYVLVTTSKTVAMKFVDVMHKGFPDFNCSVNLEKFVTNFNIDHSGVTTLNRRDPLPFIGYLMDPQTLSLCVDYTRYIGQSIGNTMGSHTENPGTKMKNKVLSLLTQRCTPGLINSEASSIRNVVRNIYEMFLLAAFRMQSLSLKFRRRQGPDKNPKFFLDVITACATAVSNKAKHLVSSKGITFSLSKAEIKWTLNLHRYPLYQQMGQLGAQLMMCFSACLLQIEGHRLCFRAFMTRMELRGNWHKVVKGLRKTFAKLHKQMDYRNRNAYTSIVEDSGVAFRHVLI